MKLNIDGLLEGSPRVTWIKVAPGTEVFTIGEPVDATTGVRAAVSANALRGLSVWEAARSLHEAFAGDALFVVRAPTSFALVRPAFSELPVFYQARGEVLDAWTGFEAPRRLVERPPGFNLEYLKGALLNAAWQTPATGLMGVFELLSGAVLLGDGDGLRQIDLLAASVRALRTNDAADYEAEVAQFRALIVRSVEHKTRDVPDAFSIKCSGGVDSAVVTVAAAVVHAGRSLDLLNSYSEEDRHGDERFYFDAIASHVAGRRTLVETNARSSRTGLSSELLAATVRPCKLAGTVATTAQLHEAAQANGSRVVLSGDGGDQLFLRARRTAFAREFMREAGSPCKALKALAGLAIMERATFWDVAGEAATGRKARKLRERYFGALRFPSSPIADVAVQPGAELVPNASLLVSLGPSRVFQYFGMRNAELNRIRFKGCAVEERKVFVFWPLVRAAIRAKRVHHVMRGRDRALERDAFKAELPQVIYDRAGKGAGREVLARFDYPTLARQLIESPACRHGLVSAERLERAANQSMDAETAFALVRATAVADWMRFYEAD